MIARLSTCLLFLGLIASQAKLEAQTDFNCDALRLRWYGFLTGGQYDPRDGQVRAKLDLLSKNTAIYWKNGFVNDTAARKTLWKDLDYRKSADITTSYTRLYTMALSYKSQGTSFYHNQELKTAILRALEWLYQNHFNLRITVPKTGGDHNWWDFRIGSPEKLNNIMVLLYDDIAPQWRESFINVINHVAPDVSSYTGANLVWISRIVAVSGILAKNPQRIDYAINSLKPVFDYVEQGDGFYHDGSFIQHNKHPYNAGYGVSLVSALAELFYLFPIIPHRIPVSRNIYQWINRSYQPIIYRGGIMSALMGREIARKNVNEHNRAKMLTEAIILLAQQADTAVASELNAVAKTYLLAQADRGLSSITLIRLSQAILQNKSIKPLKSKLMYRQFAHMDRAVQQGTDYAFMLSMHSSRIYNFESINEENLKGWHLSDGMTYLYNADIRQFEDNFWSTVDYQHLPGTTTLEESIAHTNKVSSRSWVGGVGLEDRFGLSGMDLNPYNTTLQAKKSWFMLDGEIVCLGAAIANKDNKNVFTTIEQRKLDNENNNVFTLDGKIVPPELEAVDQKDIQWMHLSGNSDGADIGYYFPEKIDLQIRRSAQVGRWSQVRSGTDSSLQRRYYLKVWKDHGNHVLDLNLDANRYAYVLLPGYSAARVRAYAKKPGIDILSNTSSLQAVRNQQFGLTAANFWEKKYTELVLDGKVYLSCDKQASIMIRETADMISFAIADPTMDNTDTISIVLNHAVSALITPEPRVKIMQTSPVLRFSVDVRDLKGDGVHLQFKK